MVSLPLAEALKIKTENKKTKLELTLADCRKLVVEHKSENSDAEYKPGVDVNGKPVTAADLNSTEIDKPLQNFNLPFWINLNDLLTNQQTQQLKNQNQNKWYKRGILSSKATVAKIDFDAENNLRINGKPIGNKAQRLITEKCRKKFPNL